MIRVGIVDDHRLLVEGLAAYVNNSDVAQVVGFAFSRKECLENIHFWNADVILLDVSLPDGSGIDLCAELISIFPSLKIMALTTHNEYSVVKQMLDNGAQGYLIKNAMSEEVLEAIAAVYDGNKFLCHEVDLLLKLPEHENIWLTQREKEVLQLISDGLTNAEVGEKLFISAETVKTYRKNLLFKLCAKNTAILIKKAIELKLIE